MYENSILGGICPSGWSPTADGGGTGVFTLSMPNATIIYQAYLLAGVCGVPAPLTVNFFNGTTYTPLTFNSTTRAGQTFTTAYQASSGASSVHAIDVTALISVSTTLCTITIPVQPPAVQRFSDFMLVVVYQTGMLPYTDCQIFINENNIAATNSRTLDFVGTIDNTKPVGMGLFTGYCCNDTTSGGGSHDSTNVLVNSVLLGHFGSTTGGGSCVGAGFINPAGNFTYAQSVLTAGANCNTNQAVSGLDVLSDIKVPVGAGATSYVLDFNTVDAANMTNNLWAVITAFTHTNPDYEGDLCGGGSPTVSNITSSGANIGWCPKGDFTTWTNKVQWRLWQTASWTSSADQVDVNTYSITGLASNTFYEFRILSVTADGALLRPSPITRFKTT